MSEKITMQGGKLCVPENPIIPFVEGDGTGPDITRAAFQTVIAARVMSGPVPSPSMKGMIGFSGTHSFPPCMVIFSLMQGIIPKRPAGGYIRPNRASDSRG